MAPFYCTYKNTDYEFKNNGEVTLTEAIDYLNKYDFEAQQEIAKKMEANGEDFTPAIVQFGNGSENFMIMYEGEGKYKTFIGIPRGNWLMKLLAGANLKEIKNLDKDDLLKLINRFFDNDFEYIKSF